MAFDINAIINQGGPAAPQYHTVPWFDRLIACTACPARLEARRVVPGIGPTSAEILFVGQNPGEEEDQRGIPFIGRAGDELKAWVRLLGLDETKVLLTNILKCHTENNRPPRPKEIETCESLWLREELRSFTSVQVVIPLGRPALFGLVGKMANVPDVMEPWYVRTAFDDQGASRPLLIVPLVHPAYILRTSAARGTLYERVLPTVREYLLKEAPDVYQRAAVA